MSPIGRIAVVRVRRFCPGSRDGSWMSALLNSGHWNSWKSRNRMAAFGQQRSFNSTGDSVGRPGARNNHGGLSSHQVLVG